MSETVAAGFSPRPLWSVTDRSLLLEYPVLGFLDSDAELATALMAEVNDDHWLFAGDGFITVSSGGTNHYPEVTLEAWDYEPPADTPEWRDTAQTQLTLPGGSLHLFAATDGQSAGPGLIPPPADGYLYHARVSRLGGTREKTVEDLVFDLSEAGWPAGQPRYLEQWRLQLWPAD